MSHLMSWQRREVLAGALAGGGVLALAACANVPNPPGEQAALAREAVRLPAAGGRATELVVWTPPRPRGVVLFSADRGSGPDRYAPLIERLGGMGLAILAPLHGDTSRLAGEGGSAQQQVLQERIADLAASAALAQTRFAGLRMLAVGHGFGSLSAMALGGALAEAGTFTEPTPRGVIAFSASMSAGGRIAPDAFANLGVPLLVLSESGGGLPQGVSGLPGGDGADSYALVLAGARPDFIHDPAFMERAWPVIDLFVQAYMFDIITAGDVLERWPATGEDRFIARRAGS